MTSHDSETIVFSLKPNAEDMALRKRTHARLMQARLEMGAAWLLHPAHTERQQPARRWSPGTARTQARLERAFSCPDDAQKSISERRFMPI